LRRERGEFSERKKTLSRSLLANDKPIRRSQRRARRRAGQKIAVGFGRGLTDPLGGAFCPRASVDDEKGIITSDTPDGPQEMIIISEPSRRAGGSRAFRAARAAALPARGLTDPATGKIIKPPPRGRKS
jgi:hypothetical protein